ncbi:MAG: putative O-glycosylation ligase, exosortase A system-associated [Nitrospirae bacterium]|nr:putative O-glycosylation ligase, exosortase A system-associated [Nitrospirota bacterium]
MRTLLVIGIFLFGIYQSLRSPFHALLLYLWVAHFRPQGWAYNSLDFIPMSMIAAVIVLGYTLLVHRRYSLNALQLYMLLFCFLGALSTWQSVNVEYSWTWYQVFLKVVIITYVLSVLVDDLHKFRWAVFIICVSLGAEAAKQGLVGLVVSPGAMNPNRIEHLGDNNGVGLGMLMLLSLTLGLFQASTKRWERAFLALLALGVLVRAVTTYSRGAFVTLAVLLAFLWWQNTHKFRSVFVIGLLLALVGAFMPQQYYDRMATITEVVQDEGVQESSAASRLYLWGVAAQMANDHPLNGVGFNAFSEAYGWYDLLDGAYGERKEAHGSLPGVFADTGYTGGSVYVLMLLTALYYMRRVKRQAGQLGDGGRTLRCYATGLQNALICFMVGGSFLSAMYYEIIWHVLGLCAALALISRRMLAEQAREAAKPAHPDPMHMAGDPAFARTIGR